MAPILGVLEWAPTQLFVKPFRPEVTVNRPTLRNWKDSFMGLLSAVARLGQCFFLVGPSGMIWMIFSKEAIASKAFA